MNRGCLLRPLSRLLLQTPATSGPHLTTAYHATPHRATLQRAGLSKSEATKITAGGGGGNQAFGMSNPPHKMSLVMSESNKELLGIEDEVFLESQIDRMTLRALHQRSAMGSDKVRAVWDAAQELRDPLLPKSVLALLAIPTPRLPARLATLPSTVSSTVPLPNNSPPGPRRLALPPAASLRPHQCRRRYVSRRRFRLYDMDDSGAIDKAEFKHLVRVGWGAVVWYAWGGLGWGGAVACMSVLFTTPRHP